MATVDISHIIEACSDMLCFASKAPFIETKEDENVLATCRILAHRSLSTHFIEALRKELNILISNRPKFRSLIEDAGLNPDTEHPKLFSCKDTLIKNFIHMYLCIAEIYRVTCYVYTMPKALSKKIEKSYRKSAAIIADTTMTMYLLSRYKMKFLTPALATLFTSFMEHDMKTIDWITVSKKVLENL